MSALGKKPSREGGSVLVVVLFLVYLVLLAWIVLWKLEVPYVGGGALREIKLVPLAASAGFGASAPFEVVMNLLLFVPFGLYLGLLAPGWRWWKPAGRARDCVNGRRDHERRGLSAVSRIMPPAMG